MKICVVLMILEYNGLMVGYTLHNISGIEKFKLYNEGSHCYILESFWQLNDVQKPFSAKVNRKNYGKFYDKNTQDLRLSPCEVTILATLIVLGCGVEVAWSVVVHTPQLVSQTSPLPSRRQCHLLCVLLLDWNVRSVLCNLK